MNYDRHVIRSAVADLLGVSPGIVFYDAPDFPVIYVNNPKSGCSSIKHSLKRAQALLYSETGRKFSVDADPHHADDCLRKGGLRPREYRRKFVISCVRNPYARVLSAYLDKVHGRAEVRFRELRGKPHGSFKEFLRALAEADPKLMDGHFRPQHLNLDYPHMTYDYLFYLERPGALAHFLQALAPPVELVRFSPHAQGAQAHIGEHYDAGAAELVRAIYDSDFEAFGYRRDLDRAREAPAELMAHNRAAEQAEFASQPPEHGRSSRTVRRAIIYRRLIDLRVI